MKRGRSSLLARIVPLVGLSLVVSTRVAHAQVGGTIEDPFEYDGTCVLDPHLLSEPQIAAYTFVDRYARESRISPALIMAVIQQENDTFRSYAIGDNRSAIGYMQVWAIAAWDAGYRSSRGSSDLFVTDVFAQEDWPVDGLDGDTNIRFGVRYLMVQHTRHADSSIYGDPVSNTVSSYNAGRPILGNQTNYVDHVLEFFEIFNAKLTCEPVDTIVFRVTVEGTANGPVTVVVRGAGSVRVVDTLSGVPSSRGEFSVPWRHPPARYDLLVSSAYRLTRVARNVALPTSSPVQLPTLPAGDLNRDEIVNSLDWSLMSPAWGTDDPVSDIHRDGLVNSIDFSWMSKNWDQTGDR